MIAPPTASQITEEDEGLEVLKQEPIDTWRWGTVQEIIVKRLSDQTFWAATYRVSSDGETNELREGNARIVQVWPKERIAIVWEETENGP